jgi:uncharacterized low-complexity protein
MENKKRSVLAGSLIASAMLGVSALNANANQLFNFNELGTGSEVRSALSDNTSSSINSLALELKCGDSTKTKDGKCGEGKCGDKKKSTSKAKDGKCGEGKCGDKKKEEKKK